MATSLQSSIYEFVSNAFYYPQCETYLSYVGDEVKLYRAKLVTEQLLVILHLESIPGVKNSN